MMVTLFFVIITLDLTAYAQLLNEICPDVSTEPPLQPVSGESFALLSVNRDESACLDVAWECN